MKPFFEKNILFNFLSDEHTKPWKKITIKKYHRYASDYQYMLVENTFFFSLSLSLLDQFNDNQFQRLILYIYSIIMYSHVLENKGEKFKKQILKYFLYM